MQEIKVVIVISSDKIKKINNQYTDLILNIWDKIKQGLSLKYKFKETIIKTTNYSEIIQKIKKNEYDIGIGNFVVESKRFKDVDFTSCIITSRTVLIYEKDDLRINQMKYFNYLIKVWKFPALLLLIFMVIAFFMLNMKHKNIMDNIYYSFGIFIGKTSIVNNSNIKTIKALIIGITIYVIAYFVSVYISALTTARSVSYLSKSNKLEYSIEGERILIRSGRQHTNIIKRNGGIPVYYTDTVKLNPYVYFIEQRKKNNKISGFLHDGLNKVEDEAKKYNLQVSGIDLGNYRIGFPVNKDKQKFLKDIDLVIQRLDDNNTIDNLCKLWGETKYLMC